ncbi:MAG TPA: hypothetical protein VFA81_08250 [Burkholderiales bacterium]|nr:hypothetical protein [Burkholderiales bacterium]
MDAIGRLRITVVTVFVLALAAFARESLATDWIAMGPNPGGRLGEDMPFEGDDIIRRAPAATKEREAPPSQAAKAKAKQPCPDATKRDDAGSREAGCDKERPQPDKR